MLASVTENGQSEKMIFNLCFEENWTLLEKETALIVWDPVKTGQTQSDNNTLK